MGVIKMSWKTVRHLVYGALIGTAGVSILRSEPAKKVYTYATAYVKRGIDSILGYTEGILEDCQDINADANEINERYYNKLEEQQIEEAKSFLEEIEEEKKEAAEAAA